MKLVTLVSNNVGVDTYLELRKAVNFKPLSRTQAKKALDNSLYIVCAYIDAKIVGMGRLVGDGDRKSTRLNSSHWLQSRMPSSA